MKRKPIEPSDVQAALDGWADCIAPLGADMAERVAAHAHRLAVDPGYPGKTASSPERRLMQFVER